MTAYSQFEDMVGTWSDLQQQLWRGWFGTVQFTPSGWWQQNYRVPLSICEEMVNLGLQAQSEYTRICMKGLKPSKSTPDFVNQVSERIEMAAENWSEAQRRAWDTWFKAAKQWDPTNTSIEWSDPAESLFKAWQDAADKTLEMQAEIFSLIGSNQQSTVSAESEEKTLSKKTAAAPKKVA